MEPAKIRNGEEGTRYKTLNEIAACPCALCLILITLYKLADKILFIVALYF